MLEQMKLDLDTLCGKTSPEHSAPMAARTSARCSKKSAESSTKEPMFLDLTRGGVLFGEQAERSWATGIPSRGECSTLNSGESPSVAVASHLSQILEARPLPKYYLSTTACQGVLRRAERRGKDLPPILKAALENQSASITEWEAKREASERQQNKAEP